MCPLVAQGWREWAEYILSILIKLSSKKKTTFFNSDKS